MTQSTRWAFVILLSVLVLGSFYLEGPTYWVAFPLITIGVFLGGAMWVPLLDRAWALAERRGQLLEDAIALTGKTPPPPPETSQPAGLGDMLCDIDLDWATYYCPCSESFCTRHRSVEDLRRWLESHKSHTSGVVHEHTTADGNRAYSRPCPDERRPL